VLEDEMAEACMEIAHIKTGIKLELEVFDSLNEKVTPLFASQFEQALDEETAIIAAPIFEGVIFPIHRGWLMNIFFLESGDFYRFKAKVISRLRKGNLSFLKIKILSGIERVQRREFFRYECILPVKYRVVEDLINSDDKTKIPKDAVTKNISGGGVCIRLDEELDINKLIKCDLSLSKTKKIRFYGKVVRKNKLDDNTTFKFEAGVLFEKIEYSDKEAIVRFIFEEQRKLIKKGMV
jgi:c-di-GMP-binding flagellar brake protein YcgR